MAEALNDLFAKRGKPEIAPREDAGEGRGGRRARTKSGDKPRSAPKSGGVVPDLLLKSRETSKSTANRRSRRSRKNGCSGSTEGRERMTITPIQRRLLNASDAILDGQPDDPLYTHSVLAQTYFPTRSRPERTPVAAAAGARTPESRCRSGVASGSTGIRRHSAALRAEGAADPNAPELGSGASTIARDRRRSLDDGVCRPGAGPAPNSRDIAMFKSQLSALAAASITMALDRAESAVQVQTRIIGAFDLWFEKTPPSASSGPPRWH